MSRKIRESSRNVSKINRQTSSSKNKNNYSRSKRNNNSQIKKSQHFEDKKLEQTTRIRIDQNRLEDSESLDTSFLEGRIAKNVRNNRFAKKKILDGQFNYQNSSILKRIFFLSFLGVSIILFISIIPSLPIGNFYPKEQNKLSTERKVVLDDNYLFIGDYHTFRLDNNQFSYPIVKVCEEDYQTKDILEDMRHMIYQYNPSILFIQLGINDLREGIGEEELLSNYRQIIEEIQKNRPYAKIVVESLYPINTEMDDYDSDFFGDSVSNDDIYNINSKIFQIVKKMNIEYLDIYKELSEEKQLKEQYTEDGIHLNDKGYQKILFLIQNKIEDLS